MPSRTVSAGPLEKGALWLRGTETSLCGNIEGKGAGMGRRETQVNKVDWNRKFPNELRL